MASAFPLAWPEGWPRTPPDRRRDGRLHFGKMRGQSSKSELTLVEALQSLETALTRLGADDPIVSCNLKPTLSGKPSGGIARPADQGVAVYFERGGRKLVFARDAFDRVEENARSIALALEAMHTLERHGGATMTEKAFTGFTALPPPNTCWEILGLPPGANALQIKAAWRMKIAGAHPDQGGSEAAAAEVNRARDDALKLAEGA